MSATIIAFPAAERLAEVELERQGDDPVDRARDTGRAIAADLIGGFPVAAPASRLDQFRRMVARLERSHPFEVDDEFVTPFGLATLRCSLRGLPDMLTELFAHWPPRGASARTAAAFL